MVGADRRRNLRAAAKNWASPPATAREWLAHRGTISRVLLGDNISTRNMQAFPVGTPGTVWFKTATPFEYFNDPGKTQEAPRPTAA